MPLLHCQCMVYCWQQDSTRSCTCQHCCMHACTQEADAQLRDSFSGTAQCRDMAVPSRVSAITDAPCHVPPAQILVGNKSDMADEKRAVPYAKGKALADEYKIQFFETSAKDNTNVEEVGGRSCLCACTSCRLCLWMMNDADESDMQWSPCEQVLGHHVCLRCST